MSVRLIIDSTTDAPRSLQDKVEVVPLVITFGDTEYLDGIEMGHKQFYEKLIESDVLPTTSQPAPASFAHAHMPEQKKPGQADWLWAEHHFQSAFHKTVCVPVQCRPDIRCRRR